MLRFRLVVLIYLLALIPATLLSGNPDGHGHFYWHTFWKFELIVPTIIGAFILAIAWVADPVMRRGDRF
jgi:hypothetical protein